MTLPFEFIKANIHGNLVDDQNPNGAWPLGLEYEDSHNDRWRFSYGRQRDNYENQEPLGWTRVGYLDINLPKLLNVNVNVTPHGTSHGTSHGTPLLANVYQQDMTQYFTYSGYEITEYIGNILLEGFVVPIRHGFVFVTKLEVVTAAIFVPETEGRLKDIIRMRNKQAEIAMSGGESTKNMLKKGGLGMSVALIERIDLIAFGGFRY